MSSNTPIEVQIEEQTIAEVMSRHGVTRRQFLGFCGIMAAALALPASAREVLAQALSSSTRIPVVWLEFQDCTGDSESFLRAGNVPDPLTKGTNEPSLSSLLLDILSLEYHETLMVPSGGNAEKSRTDVIEKYNGKYICIVEGSIPIAENGVYCVIGGQTAQSILQETVANAQLTIAYGSCAWDGGLAAADAVGTNLTGARGVRDAAGGNFPLVNIPGCPANVVNLVATLVYYLAHQAVPPLDPQGRPTFAYGKTVHSQCPKREKDEVNMWGDASHRAGGCLKKIGCHGPETMSNCPTVQWNGGTCWPVAAGHGCIGCTNSHFWDTMTPFYTSNGD